MKKIKIYSIIAVIVIALIIVYAFKSYNIHGSEILTKPISPIENNLAQNSLKLEKLEPNEESIESILRNEQKSDTQLNKSKSKQSSKKNAKQYEKQSADLKGLKSKQFGVDSKESSAKDEPQNGATRNAWIATDWVLTGGKSNEEIQNSSKSDKMIIADLANNLRLSELRLKNIVEAFDKYKNGVIEYKKGVNDYKNIVANYKKAVDSVSRAANRKTTIKPTSNLLMQSFWIKVGFSIVFCIAALYVVLSNKYEDETRKWAFGVLAIIVGVWVGTVS